jgi:hypothetical protein
MKCLIGILYSGESQLEACKAAIANQTHTAWDIIQISDLPKKQAHEALYDAFNKHADKVDLFVKIDADMELYRNDFLEELTRYFAQNPNTEQLTMKVDDFYTARNIWGLNVFRSSVVFIENDAVYTDKAVRINEDKIKRLKRHKTLVPAARHGYDPTDYHSFYFGCHKAVKVMHRKSRSHMRNIRRLPLAASLQRDNRPLIAYAGAAIAFEKQFEPDWLDRDNGKLQTLFDTLYPSGKFSITDLLKHYKMVSKSAKMYLSD